MNLLDVRAKLAAALAPVADDDPTVLADLVDSLEPPALMIGWGEPWLTAQNPCLYDARLIITAVAERLVPGSGIETLEQLVEYTRNRLRVDEEPWPVDSVGGPRVFTIGGVNYLAARITVRTAVTLE